MEAARRLADFERGLETLDADERKTQQLHILQLRSRLEWLSNQK